MNILVNNDIESISKINNIIIPWTEKYRPRLIENIVADENVIIKINKIINDRDMPNIIITGNPGIGKTSTIICIAMNILGKYMKEAFMESNASDERGIKAVEDNVELFCKKKINFEDDFDNNLIYAKHKIILLDEADNMTEKAQRLIHKLMKNYNNTRFAFTCNTSSKIIEAIQSECIIIRFKSLSHDQIFNKLEYICKNENLKYTNDGLSILSSIIQGDLRQAINSLQVLSVNFPIVSVENIYKIYDKPELIYIKNIFINIFKKNFKDSITILLNLKKQGYSSSDIVINMLSILKNNDLLKEIPENIKIIYIKKISKTYFYINQGVDTDLQLIGCLANLYDIQM